MKAAIIVSFTLIIALASILGACDTENKQSMNVQNGKGVQVQSGRANTQSMNARDADGTQVQSGWGNKQSMNVGGGNASQSQSGWGNKQSMNIGNVDGKGKTSVDKDDDEEVIEVPAGATVSISQDQSGVGKTQSTTVVVGKKK
jgi:hypothetical protein